MSKQTPRLAIVTSILTSLAYALSTVLGVLLIRVASLAAAVIIPFALLCLYASLFKRWRVEMVAVWPLSFGFFIYGAYVISNLPSLATAGILVLGGITQGLRLISFSYSLEGIRERLQK